MLRTELPVRDAVRMRVRDSARRLRCKHKHVNLSERAILGHGVAHLASGAELADFILGIA